MYPTYAGGTTVEFQNTQTSRYSFSRHIPVIPANMTRINNVESSDILNILAETLAISKRIQVSIQKNNNIEKEALNSLKREFLGFKKHVQ